MKRSLILVLILLLLIPTAVVGAVAYFGIETHEKAMSRVMESYVLNVAESVAGKISASDQVPFRMSRVMLSMEKLDLFSWGPELPGWVAVLDSDGKLIISSPGAEQLSLIWTVGLPLNRAIQVKDNRDERYTMSVVPTTGSSTYYVVAAVRWSDLLGPMVRSSRLWGLMILTIALFLGLAVMLLWRWVIGPLKKLIDDVTALRWGDEVPAEGESEAVVELRNLRRVFCRLSLAAKDRIALWKRYTSDMVRVQEDEKDRLAREIHDGPVQAVTALIQRIRLSQMDEKGRLENLHIAEEIGTDTVRELRELCNQLTPPWLDLGLENALTELTERLSRYMNVKIHLDFIEEKLSSDGTLAFFRITQEAVSNAVKHGKATEITVRVDRLGGHSTRLIIEDNGSGFKVPDDLESLRASGHRGLLNMRERIQLIGGEMKIISLPGKGTSMIFTAPDVAVPSNGVLPAQSAPLQLAHNETIVQ